LEIVGRNDAPVLASGIAAAVEDGPTVIVDLAALGSDVDSDDDGTTLTYDIIAQPSEGSASISGTTLTFDPGTDFQDLALGETRDVVIQVQATDSHSGLSNIADVTVTVTGTNDDPVFVIKNLGTRVQEDGLLTNSGRVTANDPDGDLLTYSIQGSGVGNFGTYTVDAEGIWTYTLDNANPAVQAFSEGELILDTQVVLEISDGNGGLLTTNIVAGIDGANDAPDAVNDRFGAPDIDILVGRFGGLAAELYLNDGSGQFALSGPALPADRVHDVEFADVDGDGDLDVALGNSGDNRILLNDGTGQLVSPGLIIPGSITDLEFGDLDGDGDVDLFLANNGGDFNEVWLNDGAGQFTNTGQTLGKRGVVSLGDLDGDGDLDAYIGGPSTKADEVWFNDGSGNFVDSGQSLVSGHILGIELADLDGDRCAERRHPGLVERRQREFPASPEHQYLRCPGCGSRRLRRRRRCRRGDRRRRHHPRDPHLVERRKRHLFQRPSHLDG
jgi:VCBS repeat-containing protein